MLQRSRKSLVSAAFLTLSLLALLVWIIAPTVPTNPSQHSFQYFSEIELHPSTRRLGKNVHQDTRHASHRVPDADYLHLVQQNLLETYFSQIGSWNIETWIAHGTLLGWYWNQKLLPWDTDVDVQMSMESLRSIADRFNGSTHTFSYGGRRRSYTLDVNPAYTTASILDTANRIDARWIDVQEGNFIDITAVRYVSAERLFCKDGHYYTVRMLGLIFARNLTALRPKIFSHFGGRISRTSR